MVCTWSRKLATTRSFLTRFSKFPFSFNRNYTFTGTFSLRVSQIRHSTKLAGGVYLQNFIPIEKVIRTPPVSEPNTTINYCAGCRWLLRNLALGLILSLISFKYSSVKLTTFDGLSRTRKGKMIFLSVSVKRICSRWPAHSKGYVFLSVLWFN